jgi:hypothetical protein
MALDTGRYTITNVRFRNAALLRDPHTLSDVVCKSQTNDPGEKVKNISLPVQAGMRDLSLFPVGC